MRARIAVITTAVLLTALTGCGSSNDDKAADPTSETPAGRADREAARDAARKAAGLPPEPGATARYAFLEELDAIDPRISKPGKDDQTVSRGINQCGSIKTTKDRAKLIESALDRFTISTRLPEIATPETGGRILEAVHTHLCPDF